MGLDLKLLEGDIMRVKYFCYICHEVYGKKVKKCRRCKSEDLIKVRSSSGKTGIWAWTEGLKDYSYSLKFEGSTRTKEEGRK